MKIFYVMPFIFLGIHIYFYYKLRRAYGPKPILNLTFVFLISMVILRLPPVRRLIQEYAAWVWPVLGPMLYVWLGVAAFLFTVLLIGEAAALALKLGQCLKLTKIKVPSPRRAMNLSLGATFILVAASVYQAFNIQLVTVALESKHLPPGRDRLVIAQLTDVHIDAFTGARDLKKMIALAESQNPDLVAITGDLIDVDMKTRPEETALLNGIKSRYGTVAVLGNHEFYAGWQESLDFFKKPNIRLLQNETIDLGGIIVAGVTDPTWERQLGPLPLADTVLGPTAGAGKFVLLLQHRPEIPPEAWGRFDLALTGHTHHGQIWPGGLLAKLANDYEEGLTVRSAAADDNLKDSHVYNSPGAGFWGPPMRFLTTPEVTVFVITRPQL